MGVHVPPPQGASSFAQVALRVVFFLPSPKYVATGVCLAKATLSAVYLDMQILDVFFDVFTFRSAVKPCRSANSHITQSHCEHVQLHRASILVLKTPHTRWSAFLLSLPCPISVKSGPNSSLKVLCNYRGF